MSVGYPLSWRNAEQPIAHRPRLAGPVDARAEVGHGLEDVHGRRAVGGDRGVGDRRHGDEPGRVGHQLAPVDEGLEGAVPVLPEVDVVVGDVRARAALRPHVPDDGRGGVGAAAHRAGRGHPGQQPVVGHGEVEGADDGVGREPLAVLGLDPGHGPVRSAGGSGGRGRRGGSSAPASREGLLHGARHGVHPALGVEDPAHAVHVGDDREDRAGLGRCHAGIQRLEAEDLGEPVVGEEPGDRGVEGPEATEAQQGGGLARASGPGPGARCSWSR